MAQRVTALVLGEELGLVPSAHIVAYPSVTPVAGNPVPSFGMEMHGGKHPYKQ